VSYLNTKPLVEGLDELADEFDLIFDLPSRLADRLHAGDLDVALIPSIEAVSHHYKIVSDACIACRGEVWSVKLMCRDDELRIDTLALDEGSRTSSVLAQIILAQKFDVHPRLQLLDIDADWRECSADAVLIIGDRAMKASDSRFPVEIDLGKLWYDWTGLSFVFAVWAARESERCSPADLDRISRILSTARDQGVANVERIAREQSRHFGLTDQECHAYLSKHLHFTLGESEKIGLEMYCRYASRMMLLTEPGPICFHAAPVS
jgi:chorismate dehydratase